MYMFIYIRICVCTCIYIYIYTYMYMCMYYVFEYDVCMYLCIYVCIYTCIYSVHVCMYICTYISALSYAVLCRIRLYQRQTIKLKLRLKISNISKIPCFISFSLLNLLINSAVNCEDHVVFVVGTRMCVKNW